MRQNTPPRRLTSRRAAEREMNSVSHHTAAPIGSVMSSAVPASVPATRGGHTRSACTRNVSV